MHGERNGLSRAKVQNKKEERGPGEPKRELITDGSRLAKHSLRPQLRVTVGLEATELPQ